MQKDTAESSSIFCQTLGRLLQKPIWNKWVASKVQYNFIGIADIIYKNKGMAGQAGRGQSGIKALPLSQTVRLCNAAPGAALHRRLTNRRHQEHFSKG